MSRDTQALHGNKHSPFGTFNLRRKIMEELIKQITAKTGISEEQMEIQQGNVYMNGKHR